MKPRTLTVCCIVAVLLACSTLHAEDHWSGVYPLLTMRNNEGECGTGAVVPWQGSLWAITYAPHRPSGSSDKLYEVTPDLRQRIVHESIGGTPANRMIHRESNQLFIGPYVIDADKGIRVLPPSKLYGRLTGNARHLTSPDRLIYYATMEEGLYEVDVKTLDVRCLIRDGNAGAPKTGVVSQLPGYHGKGLYSGQGQLIYSNNGDRNPKVKTDPTVESGALATWEGTGDWKLVRRNQFTEVTGPGGIFGSSDPESDPVWAMGWDAKSVILALLEKGEWQYFRLPKGSHSYDGAHGWNTEWPRIRDIGEDDLLATMHGTFWRFPKTFSAKNTSGIEPRSNYLKVVGDFCRWHDRIVLGCDDSAKSEFLNTRDFKAEHGAPGQSNSNLWFVQPEKLDQLGTLIGRGSVWLKDDVQKGMPSDPYLFSGYDFRQLDITHSEPTAVTFAIEVDQEGDGNWTTLTTLTVPANGSVSHLFDEDDSAEWVRLSADRDAKQVTAHFQYRDQYRTADRRGDLFKGLKRSASDAGTFGLMRSMAYDRLVVLSADNENGEDARFYELTPEMQLRPTTLPNGSEFVTNVAQPTAGITEDAASIVIQEDGKRYRLPRARKRQQRNAASKPQATLKSFLPKHLARSAKVTVSSTHQNYVAKNAVDGIANDDSRWIGSGDDLKTIELAFEKQTTVKSLWIVSGWQNDPRYVANDFDVQVRAGDKWRTVEGGRVRGNQRIEQELVFDEPLKTNSLRLLFPQKGYVRIYEIAPFDAVLNVQRTGSQFATARLCREVATERDLLNVGGTFFELPARNAQGVAKIRPVSSHELAVHDFCSHNGLLLFTGVDSTTKSHHIIRSDDGQAAVWAGVIDDLWSLGKPHGVGGPWKETKVAANQPSDPYLMTAYDRKSVQIESTQAAAIRVDVDIDGTGVWVPYQTFQVEAGGTVQHRFPQGFSAYWVRVVSDSDTIASVQFTYE